MRRTMVVSVFAGCGKTWLANHQNKYGYSMRDSDSSTYEKTAGWEKEYINSFMKEAKSGKYDFIFVCQTESVIDEMDRQKIPYVIVEPDNIVWNEQESKERAKERQIIKQQWFGRFILRDNSHIKNFSKWLNHMKDIYDERTGLGQTAKPCRTRNFRIKSWISLRNGLTKPEKEAHQKLLHILANSIVLKLYDR